MTVIRSTIAYGASVFHTPTPQGATRPSGPALQLEEEQTKCARIVAGAYRSTPAHIIQTEVGIPPLDLYLNQRAANSLPRQGYRDKSYRICHQVFNAIRPRGGYRRVTASNNPATTHDHILIGWTQESTLKEWKDRWRKATTDRRNTAASLDPAWSGKEIDKRHKGLTKAESSLLTQAQTGHIGLNAYLAQRRVPGVSPAYRCGAEAETFDHIVLDCPQIDRIKLPAKVPQTAVELATALKGTQTARPLLRWFIQSGRLPEYRLAAEWDETTPNPDNADTTPN